MSILQARILVEDGEREGIEKVLKPLEDWDLVRIEEAGNKLNLKVMPEIDTAIKLFGLPQNFNPTYCIYLVSKNPTREQIKEIKSLSQKIYEITNSPVYSFRYRDGNKKPKKYIQFKP